MAQKTVIVCDVCGCDCTKQHVANLSIAIASNVGQDSLKADEVCQACYDEILAGIRALFARGDRS